MPLDVEIFFVESFQGPVDPFFSACGQANIAGPFMSSGSAVDWKNQFAPNGNVFPRSSNEDNVCTGPALLEGDQADQGEHGGWHRG